MAEPDGILAILAGKKKPGGDDEGDDGEPSTVKVRAVRDMFERAKDEDWEGASEAFHRAYVECMRKEEKSGDSADDSEPDADYDDEG